MSMWADGVGAAFVVAIVLLVVLNYRRGQLTWPHVLWHASLESLARDNLLLCAEREVLIFGGSLHRDLGDNQIFAQHLAAKPGCAVEFLVGPDVDVAAIRMLRAIKEHRHARLHLIRGDARERVQLPASMERPAEWRYRHFLVVDGCDVNVETRHTVPIGVRRPTQIEVRRTPSLGRYFARRFRVMQRSLSSEVDKRRIVTDIVRIGIFVAFEEERQRPATQAEITYLADALGEPYESAT